MCVFFLGQKSIEKSNDFNAFQRPRDDLNVQDLTYILEEIVYYEFSIRYLFYHMTLIDRNRMTLNRYLLVLFHAVYSILRAFAEGFEPSNLQCVAAHFP